MVNIITIEREYGCGGGDIAQLVASRHGWKLWDQRLTEEIARLAGHSGTRTTDVTYRRELRLVLMRGAESHGRHLPGASRMQPGFGCDRNP